jgi:UDP-N-acetylmuramoylalanine--D-glutamate ligase
MFSEIEFASWLCRGRIVAVTGSNGKTTTTELLGEIFTAARYECQVCGNVGRPFSEVTRMIPQEGVAVVEVSTFQLEKIENFKPHAALLLNLSPDHLDRHGDFETYKNLKYRITENQEGNDYLVLNMDDAQIVGDSVTTRAQKLFFSTVRRTEQGAFVSDGMLYSCFGGREEAVIAVSDILLPGPHNLQNAAAATAAAAALGVKADSIAQALKTFRGVEHRLEPLGQVAGINFINDSKATNVDSVCWALRSIGTPIYLIAGGRDKGSSYQPIIEHGRGKIKGVTVIGEAQEKIFSELGRSFPVQLADSLEEAVMISFRQAHPGETVLLSPGCASFDMFDNFEHRGQRFKEAVGALTNGQEKNETVTS